MLTWTLVALLAPVAPEGYCLRRGTERCTQAPWTGTEYGASVGYLGMGTQYGTARTVDSFITMALHARMRLDTGTAWDRLVLESSLHIVPSVSGVAPGLAGTLRVGLGFQSVAFAAGLLLRGDFTQVSPLSFLPSLTVLVRPARWGISLGVFERPYGPPARIGFEYGNWGISFAALYGAEAWIRIGTSRSGTGVFEIRGFGYSLGPLFSVGLSLGVTLGQAPYYQFGGAR